MSTLPHQLEQSSLAGLAIAALALASLAWLSLQTNRIPAALAADAPAPLFSAARAMPMMRTLAQAPEPMTNNARGDTHAAILARLHALGLTPQGQTGNAQIHVSAGVSHNVLVRIKGSAIDRRRRPALLVAAYFDNARPGTARAWLPVATMLETLRALRFHTPLENDVMFLFAEADQAGMPGARAFAQQHPWARTVGLVLQFDAIGNSGPVFLSSSRGGNGKLVDGWIAAAPTPLGNAALPLMATFATGLQQAGPLDGLGSAGLRFANFDGATGNMGSVAQAGPIDPATVQHAGESMLSLVRHFGNVPLGHISDSDCIYFSLPLLGQVSYGAQFAWLLTLFTSFVFVVVCALAVRRSGMQWRTLCFGALVFVALAAAMALMALLLWQLPSLHAGRWHLSASMALGTALFVAVQRQLGHTIGLPATVLGAKLVLVLALLVSSALLPGASYLLAWPMLAALLAYGALYQPWLAYRSSLLRMLILVAGTTPAVLLFVPALAQMATLFTPQHSGALMLALALAVTLATGGALLASLHAALLRHSYWPRALGR